MTLFERIKSILGIKNVKEDLLLKVSNELQLQIGFSNVREEMIKKLETLAAEKSENFNFALLGQQGLGKTVVASKLITPYLFSIKKIDIDIFTKIDPSYISKEALSIELTRLFNLGKGGVIFIDGIDTLKEKETALFTFLKETIKDSQYAKTAFIVTSGDKTWSNLCHHHPFLVEYFRNEIYFRPYTNEELAQILKSIIEKDDLLDVPVDSVFTYIIKELKDVRNRQKQIFANASELAFYYFKCLKPIAVFTKRVIMDEDLIEQSIKKFITASKK
jgi:Cdc6-like AAA superfamily ATPase